jgi:hypothetical protein
VSQDLLCSFQRPRPWAQQGIIKALPGNQLVLFPAFAGASLTLMRPSGNDNASFIEECTHVGYPELIHPTSTPAAMNSVFVALKSVCLPD